MACSAATREDETLSLSLVSLFGKLILKARSQRGIIAEAVQPVAEDAGIQEKPMTTNPTAEYDEILARVRTWPPEQQLHLAGDLLRSLPHLIAPDGLRGVPVEKVCGVAAGAGSIPDDDTVRRWIEEHRAEKYG